MPTVDSPPVAPMGDSDTQPGQYATDSLDDGSIRIYDTENEDAWIRSDTALDVAWQT